MQRFALIGAAGYIAPRHMRAIRETGNDLVAALDPSDSVGVLDSHFPDAHFFTEFERFDRHLDKARRAGQGVHYVSIASPNYLHDSHMRFALRSGAHAVCEKPLVLNPWNLDGLKEVEQATGRRVNTILQLRLHPAIQALKQRFSADNARGRRDVELTYITSRGNWYLQSWKGDDRKSGGIPTNIGVHFFDMLHYVFGPALESTVHLNSPTKAAGRLEHEHASVRWFLSIDAGDVPEAEHAAGKRTFREIVVDGEAVEFSEGFTDLHTRSYEAILAGNGFGLEDSRAAVETVSNIRSAPVVLAENAHPFIARLKR